MLVMKFYSLNLFLSSLLLTCTTTYIADACTDILVTPGASQDGSAMIAYNADDVSLYGVLYHYAAAKYDEPTSRKIYDWDSGKYLGEIKEATETYNVVGNANEYGLVIGETTFSGVEVLQSQEGAIMDYGSLIYVTLQRAKTAIEAIHTMVSLMDTYGYASTGESFSIGDASGDVWMMEVISRGNTYGKKGSVYVAVKIPDGSVAAHANQARITTFPRDDPENCLYADDVVDVAIHYGLYDPTGKDDELDFSFSDVYNPVTPSIRLSDARVWDMFSSITNSTFELQYQDYILGFNLTNRMPLYVTPSNKLSVLGVMTLLGSHYEGTALDGSNDVGSGLYASPYRPRPITWTYDEKTYFNERNIATERTGWSFVAQIRTWMPRELATVSWFTTDDPSTSPRVPIYSSSTKVADAYVGKGSQDGVLAPLLQFNLEKSFWVQNMVSNLCYSRWSEMYPVVRHKIDSIHGMFLKKVSYLDETALEIYNTKGREAAVEFLTNASVDMATKLHSDWWAFYGQLFAGFRDFHRITPDMDDAKCNCKVTETGMSDNMKRRIILETGTRYLMPEAKQKEKEEKKQEEHQQQQESNLRSSSSSSSNPKSVGKKKT